MKKTLLFIALFWNISTAFGQTSDFTLCLKEYCTEKFIEDATTTFSKNGTMGLPVSPMSMFNMGLGCISPSFTLPDSTLAIEIDADSNPLSGISTYDLLLIASHINGTQPFTCPYQWIAADVNNDQLVDSTDIVELRNLILGTYSSLPNAPNLKVFPVDFSIDPANPLANPLPTQPFIFPTNNIPTNLAYYGIFTGRVSKYCDCLNSSASSVQKIDQIIVAPNPTQDWVTIAYFGALNTNNYVIYDIMGKAVTQGVLAGQTTKISLANCPNGIYTLCVHSEKGLYKTMKISKI